MRWSRVLHGCLAVIGFAAVQVASAQALPAGCTPADQQRAIDYQSAGADRLVQQDLDGYMRLVAEFERGLGKRCMAALERAQPDRKRCTLAERKLAIEGIALQYRYAAAGQLDAIFEASEALEQQLSRGCWLAINQPTAAVVRGACSPGELDQIAAHASPLRDAMRVMLSTLDVGPFLNVTSSMFNAVSPPCQQAMQQAVAQAQSSGRSSLPMEGRVLDHGNGTYSVPGLGACTPSGCMSY